MVDRLAAFDMQGTLLHDTRCHISNAVAQLARLVWTTRHLWAFRIELAIDWAAEFVEMPDGRRTMVSRHKFNGNCKKSTALNIFYGLIKWNLSRARRENSKGRRNVMVQDEAAKKKFFFFLFFCLLLPSTISHYVCLTVNVAFLRPFACRFSLWVMRFKIKKFTTTYLRDMLW